VLAAARAKPRAVVRAKVDEGQRRDDELAGEVVEIEFCPAEDVGIAQRLGLFLPPRDRCHEPLIYREMERPVDRTEAPLAFAAVCRLDETIDCEPTSNPVQRQDDVRRLFEYERPTFGERYLDVKLDLAAGLEDRTDVDLHNQTTIGAVPLLVNARSRRDNRSEMSSLDGIRFGPQIEAAARDHGLDPRFLAAVAAQETGGPGSDSGRNVIGDGGHGRGLFQIDDRYHAFARTGAAMDPQENAEYAASMLAVLIRQNGGDLHAALSAYNAGSPTAPGTTTRWGDGSRLGYADSVFRHYEQLGSRSSGSADSPPLQQYATLASQSLQLPQPSATTPQTPQEHWQAQSAVSFGSDASDES